MRLAPDNAHGQHLGNAHVTLEIIRRDRLLEPVNVIGRNLAANLDCNIGAPALVDIYHDRDVGSERFTHAPHIVDVALRVVRVRDLHLDGFVAQ